MSTNAHEEGVLQHCDMCRCENEIIKVIGGGVKCCDGCVKKVLSSPQDFYVRNGMINRKGW